MSIKCIPGRSQVELRNLVLEIGGKASLGIKYKRMWLKFSVVFKKVELVSDEL
jgi:hypothetical protein